MPNNRERFLLAVFLSALVAAAGAIGWGAFSRSIQAQKVTLERNREKLKTLNHWLDNKETWRAKGQWVDANPPPSYGGPETEATFVQAIQGSLGKRNIEIVEQRIQETRPSGRLVEVQIDMVLSASLENLIGWLHDTQKIDSYRAITHIKLKSDAGNFKVRADVSLVQFYAIPGG